MKWLKITLVTTCGLVAIYFGLKILRSLLVVDEVAELKTDHFVIMYRGIYASEANDVAENLEKNYDRIRSDLNDPLHEIIRVFVHATQNDFNEATGLPNSTANGTSRGPNEFHFIWTNWFNSIFPNDPVQTAIHEFTHCVQLNILIKHELSQIPEKSASEFDRMFEEKFINHYPQWFWEALCDYEAGVVNTISVKYGMTTKPTLKRLNSDSQIYNVGYTIVEYIVDRWDKEKLPELITSYVDLEKVLGVSESEFEKGWVDFVNEKY